MDKNFFTFDIDDEILKSENDNISSQKVQNDINLIEKTSKDAKLIDVFIANKVKMTKSNAFEINEGLPLQREINSNINDVEDLINFDFKSKEKLIAAKKEAEAAYEMEENLARLKSQMESDQEVVDVIEKAHIGVIFY